MKAPIGKGRRRTRRSTAKSLHDEQELGQEDVDDRGDPGLYPQLMIPDVSQWLLREVSSELDAEGILEEMSQRLCDSGIGIWRSSYNIHTLHTETYVRNIVWTYGEGCQSTTISHFDIKLPIFKDSPVAAIYGGSSPIRRKLTGPDATLDFPICTELRDEGATDYLILPLCFSDGRRTYVSFTTKEEGGFSEMSVQRLINLSPFIALRLELESATFATNSLLQLYLGKKAADRVVAGDFKRGQGEEIDAVIWFCDLRDFTQLTSELGSLRIVETLDRYFESVANAIAAHDGEILKFIGDAVLAVFEFPDGDAERACHRALAAAHDVRATLEELRATQSEDEAPVHVGIALHAGRILFGNIGGHERLDFTVIGSAVNEVCRMEALCKDYGVDLLVSDRFVDCAGGVYAGAVHLGCHELKGVDREVDVFTIPRDQVYG